MVHFEDGPNFQWPHITDHRLGFPNQHPVTDSTTDVVINTIKNIVDSFANKSVVTTPSLQESSGSNSTVMDTVTDMIDSNNTAVTEMMGSNNTGMNEMFGNNTNVITTENSGIVITDAVSTIVDSVVTTTESIINTISNVVTTKTTFETTTEDFYNLKNHGEESEEATLYIVVGVILLIMLLLIVILLIIYRRYKNRSSFRSGVYCVTNLKEISTSSCNQKEAPIQQRMAKYP